MRTIRIVVVAAAVGAIAGGGVVLSLVERPEPEDASIAARTLVEPESSLTASVAVPAQVAPIIAAPAPRSRMAAAPHAPADAAAEQVSPAVAPTTANAVAERPANNPSPAVAISAEPAAPDELAPAQKSAAKPRRIVIQQPKPAAKGPLDLLRSFAARATSWPPRAD